MIPANAMQLVKGLHDSYVARTGYDIAYNMARENTWREWCQWGNWTWTGEDLTRVIGYLRKKIAKGERNEGALKFANLIGRPDNFEEDLNLAREEGKKVFGGRRSKPSQEAATCDEAPKQDPAEAARNWKELFKKT
jgi:hypothetical protein